MRFDKESGEWRDGEIATDHVGLVGGAVIYINDPSKAEFDSI